MKDKEYIKKLEREIKYWDERAKKEEVEFKKMAFIRMKTILLEKKLLLENMSDDQKRELFEKLMT
jgi:hypothetical protein